MFFIIHHNEKKEYHKDGTEYNSDIILPASVIFTKTNNNKLHVFLFVIFCLSLTYSEECICERVSILFYFITLEGRRDTTNDFKTTHE